MPTAPSPASSIIISEDESPAIRIDEEILNSPRSDVRNSTIVDNEPDSSEFKMMHVNVDIPVGSKFSWKKLLSFVGPGFFVSVGYLDPGNWATDIEGGSRFGYKLIWVLFMSNLIALMLQTLAARLGLVTEKDLAQLCRREYPKPVCYTLWILCEIAIAATDLAEVLGTAIGLELLLGIPLIAGVIITAFDTLIFLLIQRYGVRKLEWFIFALLSVITTCFIIELFLCKPPVIDILGGFIPSINSESLYVALGMLGATVMPHNFYLHSSVVQSRKFGRNPNQIKQACLYNLLDSGFALNVAFFVNMSILVVAAKVFYTNSVEVTEIQDAHNLLEGFLNSALAPIAFGLGLFCAGQSSTLTGTMAGQIVMEGFVQMKVVPWLRRLITRMIAIIPAVIVIAIMGNKGTYQMLIFSQVVLSVQLPFAIVPLIRFTSDKKLMGQFVSPIWVLVLSSLAALLIISLNVWLVGQNIYFLLTHNTVTMAVGILVLPVAFGLLGLLGYIGFRGIREVIVKRVYANREEMHELTDMQQ